MKKIIIIAVFLLCLQQSFSQRKTFCQLKPVKEKNMDRIILHDIEKLIGEGKATKVQINFSKIDPSSFGTNSTMKNISIGLPFNGGSINTPVQRKPDDYFNNFRIPFW